MTIWYRRISSLIVAYLIQRLLFIGFNFSSLSSVSPLTAVAAFFDGMRFDLCIIATVNLPLIALHSLRASPLVVRHSRWLDHFVSGMFAAVNIPLIIFGVVDSKLFTFTGRRISLEFFDIAGDIKDQSIGIMIQFWYVTLPTIAFITLFSWFNWQKKHDIVARNPKSLRHNAWTTIAITTLGFILIRGGWQTKPLAPAHAFNWQPVTLANMVLNSGMTLLRTPKSAALHRYQDFADYPALERILRPESMIKAHIPLSKGRNVVVLIVESLATEYCGFLNNGKGYTPFIDSLAKSSVYFSQSFANGRRSIDAMPAIFGGVPAWRDQPFVTSPYAANNTAPLPRILGEMGYKTLFFHGAANGSMHFDVFSRIVGFDEYIGRNEYPDPQDHDGQWGIFDEPFLQFAGKKFTETRKPFFAGVFTLTSHNPFKIPQKYAGKFPLGTLPIHQAIGYADFALSEFFKTAATQPWYGDTIFVITGDHTSLSDNPKYANLPGRFRVPIIFYDPAGKLPRLNDTKIASHIDIKPTLMDLLGIDKTHFGLFGGSLFDPEWNGRFVQTESETWYYRDQAVQITMSGDSVPAAFDIDDNQLVNPRPISKTESSQVKTLKAERQYFTNGLLDNAWYPK
jgi:uncharacterized sulfatase